MHTGVFGKKYSHCVFSELTFYLSETLFPESSCKIWTTNMLCSVMSLQRYNKTFQLQIKYVNYFKKSVQFLLSYATLERKVSTDLNIFFQYFNLNFTGMYRNEKIRFVAEKTT